MNVFERQLLVGALFGLVIAIRMVAHHEAGGFFRDQDDGLAREGGRLLALLVRLAAVVFGIGGLALWSVAPSWVPGNLELPGWTHWLGLGLTEAGLVLLIWVHTALGVHFSGTLHLREDHRLVQRGPYAAVRHPMYTSFLLLFTGFGLLTGNTLIAAVSLGSQVWVLSWRLRLEEASLEQQFGEEWTRYRARTGALVPRLFGR